MLDKASDAEMIAISRMTSRYKLLTPQQERTLLEKAIAGDAKAKDKLIRHNMRLVCRYVIKVWRHTPKGACSFADLFQEGCIGLGIAIDKFDFSKAGKLSTLAHWWIKQRIRVGMQNQSKVIRIPNHQWEYQQKIRSATTEFHRVHRRYPSQQELSDLTGISLEQIQANRSAFSSIYSLDKSHLNWHGSDEPRTLGETIPDSDNHMSVIEEQDFTDLCRKLFYEELLPDLEGRSHKIARLWLGVDGDPLSIKESAEVLKCSPCLVSGQRTQIRQRAKQLMMRRSMLAG